METIYILYTSTYGVNRMRLCVANARVQVRSRGFIKITPTDESQPIKDHFLYLISYMIKMTSFITPLADNMPAKAKWMKLLFCCTQKGAT